MSRERAPHEVENNDFVVEPMTLDQAREAFQRGDQEAVNVWYGQQQERADEDPTSLKRFQLSVDCARIQYAAGLLDDALETVSDVNEAIQQELIELDRSDSPLSRQVNKEEYGHALKSLLHNVRNEFRR